MSRAYTISRSASNLLTFTPKAGSHSATVILCHGLGDTADGWSDVAEMLIKKLPHVKFILPTAPTSPVTMNGGYPMPSWYDIVGLDERSHENCEGIDDSVATLRTLMKEENSRGLPYNRMLLAGFSQGGAMSLFTGLQMEDGSQKLAGIAVLSGYLAGWKRFKLTPGLENTPVRHYHGDADPVVQYNLAEKSKAHCEEAGVKDYKLELYAGMAHSACMEEIEELSVFLQEVLPKDDAFCLKPKDPSEMSVKELKEAIREEGLGNKAVGLMEKSEFVKLLSDHRSGKL